MDKNTRVVIPNIKEREWFRTTDDFLKPMGSKPFDTWVADTHNQQSVIESTDELLELVQSELEKVKDQDPRRIFIGGFSQGGAMALSALFRWSGSKNLGGVLAL